METKPHESAHFLRMCKRMPFITKPALSDRDLRTAVSGPVSLRNGAGRSHVGKPEDGRIETEDKFAIQSAICVCDGQQGERREEGHRGRQRWWRRRRRLAIDIRDLALPPDPVSQSASSNTELTEPTLARWLLLAAPTEPHSSKPSRSAGADFHIGRAERKQQQKRIRVMFLKSTFRDGSTQIA